MRPFVLTKDNKEKMNSFLQQRRKTQSVVQAAPQAEPQQLIKSKSAKSIGHKRADSLISTKADEKVEEKISEPISPATNHFKKRPKSVGGP